MATRKAATNPDELFHVDDDPAQTGNAPGALALVDPDDGIGDALHNALTMLSGGDDPAAVVKVYRMVKGSASGEFCMQMTPAEFAENHENVIQAAFGGGRYGVRIYGSNPANNGRVSLMARGEVLIAEARNVASVPGELSPAVLSRLEQLEQRLAPVVSQASQPVDVMARVSQGVGIFTGIVAALSPIVLPLINRPASNGGSMKETLENMAALKALAGDLSGAPGEKSDAAMMMETVQALGPAFLEAMQAQRAAPAVSPPSLTTMTPQPLTLANPATPTVKAPAMDMFVLQLSMLASAAKKDGDPISWSNTILDACDEKQTDDLLTLLQKPDWFAELCGKNPEVTPHQKWFDGVRAAILAQFEPIETADTTKPATKTAAKTVKPKPEPAPAAT